MLATRHTLDEIARLGEAAFEREIVGKVSGENAAHFLVIDVGRGDFEVDADEGRAIRRLLDRNPGCQFWLRRVGTPYAHHHHSGLPVRDTSCVLKSQTVAS